MAKAICPHDTLSLCKTKPGVSYACTHRTATALRARSFNSSPIGKGGEMPFSLCWVRGKHRFRACDSFLKRHERVIDDDTHEPELSDESRGCKLLGLSATSSVRSAPGSCQRRMLSSTQHEGSARGPPGWARCSAPLPGSFQPCSHHHRAPQDTAGPPGG